MDFGTIKKNLLDQKLNNFQSFLNDINLVFANCTKFNDPKLPVIVMSNELEAKFIELCEKNEYQKVLKLGNSSPNEDDDDSDEESKNNQQNNSSDDDSQSFSSFSSITISAESSYDKVLKKRKIRVLDNDDDECQYL